MSFKTLIESFAMTVRKVLGAAILRYSVTRGFAKSSSRMDLWQSLESCYQLIDF